MIGRFIATQFRKPSGLIGRLIGDGMARGNEPEARWTIDLLNLQPDTRVLEIGFGPGVAIQYAAEQATQGHVSGVDYSETMVQVARKRNASTIRNGLVDLTHGDVRSLPYGDESFDRAFTIHCLYFWTEPTAGLREIRRVLRANGVLAITILPKDKWPPRRTPPTDVFRLYRGSDVVQLVADAGFRDARVEDFPTTGHLPWRVHSCSQVTPTWAFLHYSSERCIPGSMQLH